MGEDIMYHNIILFSYLFFELQQNFLLLKVMAKVNRNVATSFLWYKQRQAINVHEMQQNPYFSIIFPDSISEKQGQVTLDVFSQC